MCQSVGLGGTSFALGWRAPSKSRTRRGEPWLSTAMRWGLALLLVGCSSGDPSTPEPETNSDAGSSADAPGSVDVTGTVDTSGTANTVGGAGGSGPDTESTANHAGTTDGGTGPDNGPGEVTDAGGRTDEEDNPVDPDGAVGPEVGAGEIVNTAQPSLADAFVFRPLEVTAGTWLSRAELTRSYQWQRCVDGDCTDIPGATDTSYTPVLADLGARLRVVETVARDHASGEASGESLSATSNETDAVTCAEPLATEPLSAASASNVASGVEWTFTGGGFPATAAAIGAAKRSALLVSHGFGYALGEGEVHGVEVRITRRASSALSIRDQRVALYAPGPRTKTPESEYWSEGSVTSVYGGPTDTWGQEISTAAVNGSQLRLVLGVENGSQEPADAIIENVEVVLYYASFASSVFDATTVSEGGAGSAWASAASAVNEDGAAAAFGIPEGATPVTSKLLTLGGFGATMPTDVVPTGYAFEVLQAASPGLLLNSSVTAGTETDTENLLPNALGYVSYGGPGVTWGLTSEEVTSPAFNALLQVMGQGLPMAGSVEVDAVRLRVYFGSDAMEEQRASTVLETTSNETGWSDVDNVLADDGAITTTTLLSDQRSSGSLVLSGFTAAVPEGAAISGITLAVNRSATAAEQLQDIAVFLRAGADSIGVNRASSEFWPITRETVSYGGPNDRWGSSLNASAVNSGALGAELTAAHASNTGAAAPEMDSALLTVHYCTE